MNANDKRHGSNAGYLAHEKAGQKPCEPCRVARRAAQKRRRINRERGNPNRLPLGDIAWQIIANTPREQLYAATGIRGIKLNVLEKNGPETIVNRATQERILSAIGTEFWTPIGIQRRVQALQAIGYSIRAISDEMGDAYAVNLSKLNRRQEVHFVRSDFAERIMAAYDRLHMHPRTGTPSASRARNLATANGWPPPLAWTDIDDVNERPRDWHYRAPDRRAAVVDFAEQGLNATEAARRLHTSREGLEVWCRRNGLSAEYRQMAAREAIGLNKWLKEGA